jgi:hypothetical protein
MRTLCFVFLCIFLFQTGCRQHDRLQGTVWPEVTKEMKPWTRWWWMGSAVNKPEIRHQLKALAEAGFGGVEITPIYGVKGAEDHYIGFLSDQWMEILDFTIKTADSLGMGVDMNLGTGWPFGGPQITPELAASRLVLQSYRLEAGQKLQHRVVIDDKRQNGDYVELLALMAFPTNGEPIDLLKSVNKDGWLNWSPDHGQVEIIAAFNGKTRQKVKRAAPGGEGWSMDHFSEKALNVYLSRFDKAFSQIATAPRSFFNDSFEVYGSSGTRDIFRAFHALKGYDLKNHLKALNDHADTQYVRRVKSDYREVLGHLLLEEFTVPWRSWANGQGVLARSQAHGSPGNIIDLYSAVDVPECETFGSSYFPIPGLRRDSADIRDVDPDPVMMKFATSAANVLGKTLASCETFTWLAEHFKVSLSQCKPELEQVWLTGVNHVFYHGTTYTPSTAQWPGWLFYASVQFAPTNSFWQHLSGLNQYVARTQSILQNGAPDNDLLVYWPIYDVWNDAGRLDKQISIHNIDEWLHPTPFYQLSKKLMSSGYLLDFISDQMIGEISVDERLLMADEKGGKYKALIVPACELMPLQTLEKIMGLAKAGATVIFEDLPNDVPGYHDLENRRAALRRTIDEISFVGGMAKYGAGKLVIGKINEHMLRQQGIEPEMLVKAGLLFTRRKMAGESTYFLVNHTADAIDEHLILNAEGKTLFMMDPNHGTTGFVSAKIQDSKCKVRVQLEAGQTIIVRCTNQKVVDLPQWQYWAATSDSTTLNGRWELSFLSGGPDLPGDKILEQLSTWTKLDDDKSLCFSGLAAYEHSFQMPESMADGYMLDLGKVAESARVWINGVDAGILWSHPFKLNIGDYLHAGENHLRVEVANLMANRIRHMDQQGEKWRIFHDINLVNIDYEPFDASEWEPMDAGLLGPVLLHPISLD